MNTGYAGVNAEVLLRHSRELGFNQAEIRALSCLVDGGNCNCGEVKPLSVQHLQSVREKIEDLRKLEKPWLGFPLNAKGDSARLPRDRDSVRRRLMSVSETVPCRYQDRI